MAIKTHSRLSIISDSLVLLGEKPLQTLNDTRQGGVVMGAIYDRIVQNELQSNRWRFSVTKRSLSRLADSPLNEFQYAFQLPTDILLPIGIYPMSRYEIYGDRLYTDVDSVDLEFVFRPVEEKFPTYFAALVAYKCAMDGAKAITGSDSTVSEMAALYKMQRPMALYADAQGRPARPVIDSPFIAVRG